MLQLVVKKSRFCSTINTSSHADVAHVRTATVGCKKVEICSMVHLCSHAVVAHARFGTAGC